MKATVELG